MKYIHSYLARAAKALLGLCALAFPGAAATPLPDLDLRLKGAWPPYGPFTVEAIVVSNDHAFLAAGEDGLHVFDVSTPARPRHVGTLPLPGFASSLAVSGDHVFVASQVEDADTSRGSFGLHVINVRDPAHPRAVATAAMSGWAVNVAVSGTRVVVAGHGVEVFDVQEPQQPRRMGRIEVSGVVGPVAAADGIACFAELGRTNYLSVIDLSGADGPRRIGQYRIDANVAVTLKDHHAFLAGQDFMEVVDLTDPSRPRLVSEAAIEGASPELLLIGGQFAYTGTAVVDISDLLKLAEVGPIEPLGWDFQPRGGYQVALAGDALFRIRILNRGFDFPETEVLDVVDVSNPLRAQPVSTHVIDVRAVDVALSGSLAYVANGFGGLQIVDVSNPEKPERLADHPDAGVVSHVAVAGSIVCLLGHGRVVMVDVSDPRNPRNRGVYDGLSGGPSSDLTADADRAFVFVVGRSPRTLEVLDLSDPDLPRQILRLDVEASPALVPVSPQFQYTPDATEGWMIHDISDPENRVRVGSYRAIVAALGGILVGNQVHTSYGDVFDVSDPAHPQRAGSTYPTIPARSGYLGCVVDQNSTLQCYDLSEPAAPRPIGGYAANDGIRAVELRGTDAFVAAGTAGLQIVDLSRPSSLMRKPGSNFPVAGGIQGITLAGPLAYITFYGSAGLQILDLSDPEQPLRLGRYVGQSGVTDVAVADRHAYVTEGSGRLVILDLVDLSLPGEAGALAWAGTAHAVVVSGTTAFVAAGAQGLLAVDVTDPARPIELGRIKNGGGAYDVALAGSHALVANGESVQVIDVSQPSQLRWVAGHPANQANQVEVTGLRAYVWSEQELLVFDVTDPARLRLVNRVALTKNRNGRGNASIAGDYIFVVNEFGLELLDLKDPMQPRRIAGNSAVDQWSSPPLLLPGGTLFLGDGNHGVFTVSVPPFFRSISRTDGEINLEWEGWGRARLQRANAVDSSRWQDVPGTESLRSVTLPQTGANEFFRLNLP